MAATISKEYRTSIVSQAPVAFRATTAYPNVALRLLGLLICLAGMLAAFSSSAQAQTFQPVKALSFTMPFGGASPLSQVVSIGSAGAQIRFSTAVATTSGGSWLSLTAGSGCCYYTPQAITVAATPAANLAAGTYSGTITVTASGIPTLTIPVSLTIEPSTAAFLDAPAGALTFSMGVSGKTPPAQSLPIRNAGTGTLSWTASSSTSDGGAWLTLSSTSGTAPSQVSVGINPAKLPGQDLIAGTYTGQVLLKAGTDTVTVPVTIAVGASVFHQINPISFTTAFGQSSPIAQVISLAAADASSIRFIGTAINGTGGSWLSISDSGCCYYTPQSITVSATPAVTLAAGTYTSEIVLSATDGSDTIVIPVSLTVAPATASFLDETDGALTFAMQTGGLAPASQPIPIRKAGGGALAWTAAASTSDGGAWLTLSATSGTAPSTLLASVNPAALPGGGLTAGTYVGEVVLNTSGDTVTVPITFNVGDSVLQQINPLSFTKAFGGGNPSPQIISLANSDGSSVQYGGVAISSTGGNWLTLSTSGCCYSTPQAITVSVNPDITLAAGTYTAEVVLISRDGTDTVVVPVTLVIAPSTAAFFDNTNGALTFSMVTGGTAPPPQAIPIRNAGTGTLAWTASTGTADGGAWLTLSAAAGTAPSILSVSVNPAKLPGSGLTAGTYVGSVVLTSATDTITVPVSFTVDPSAFQQINPLVFTKTYAGANPPSQVIDLSAQGAVFQFGATVVNATGGNWLTTTINGCCYSTPYSIAVSVNPVVTLAAGTYTAEIVLTARNGSQSMVVPVTLIVKAASDTYFDALPGALTYSMITSGTAPPAQLVQIRNAGAGTLAWTASASTSDGGKWITLSASKGSAPYLLNVGVTPAALPGGGLIAGNYTGQVILTTSGDSVTIPVSLTVGTSAFVQINPLSFSKVYSGANPLPQTISLADADGSGNQFSASVVNSTGGNWLTVPINGCCYTTPYNITVSANPAVTLAAGTYFAEIILTARNGSQSVVVPVTLNVEPSTASFFDTLPGGLTYTMQGTGVSPAAQTLPIRNAGPGTLNWAATTLTADGGKWLTISSGTGPAPATPTVSVKAANLPGKGKIAGIYLGQVILQTVGDIVTIPVTVSVGDSVVTQVAPVNFAKSYQGANPPLQSIVLNSTDTNSFALTISAFNSTGGNWLSIAQNGCCYNTPQSITLTPNPAVNLAPGVYTAEVVASDRNGLSVSVIPVSLTVTSATATAKPTFTPPAGTYSSAQSVVIASSTIDSAIYYTIDGTTPTTASTRYTVPIQVTATETINAIAIAPGYPQSAVATAKYTITTPPAATPGGTITISEATAGVTVYYTTNGTTPTTASTKYTGPIALPASGTLTLKFIAIGTGYSSSAVRTITTSVP